LKYDFKNYLIKLFKCFHIIIKYICGVIQHFIRFRDDFSHIKGTDFNIDHELLYGNRSLGNADRWVPILLIYNRGRSRVLIENLKTWNPSDSGKRDIAARPLKNSVHLFTKLWDVNNRMKMN
jgi:hypothetical protein